MSLEHVTILRRSYNFLFYLFIIGFLLISGCNEDTFEDTPIGEAQDFTVPVIIPNGNEKYITTSSEYIFDQEKLPEFELFLPVSSMSRINNDPVAEEYVEGTLVFEGDTVSPVGIRYKGSIGAFVFCLSGPNMWDPSGYKTCTKLSMKIKINWKDKDHTFYDQKKLQFHSMNLDTTQMHERLGYYLFRQMGVPAPRSVHARLKINGNYVGLFALTEQIDGRFTRQNWTDGSGNLYKEIWPVNEHGEAYPESVYISKLETNEDENPSASLIRTFGAEIQSAHADSLRPVIEKWMDTDMIMRFIVVDRTIRNDDGPFHWYCNSQGECGNHNYYWYEETGVDKLHLIPWDLDNAFENIAGDANPVTPIADEWGETSGNCEAFAYGIWGRMQRSAACDKLTAGWVSYETEFYQLKQQFLEGPFAEANVDLLLDTWADQVREATREANSLHNDALSVDEWEAALAKFREDLALVRVD